MTDGMPLRQPLHCLSTYSATVVQVPKMQDRGCFLLPSLFFLMFFSMYSSAFLVSISLLMTALLLHSVCVALSADNSYPLE